MKKFDLKKFLAENKATFHSSLREGDLMKSVGKGLEYEAAEEMIRDYADRLLGAGVDDVEDLANYYLNHPEELPEPMEYEFFKNNYDDILSLAMTGLSEGKAAYEYEKGKKAGEAIEKKKMKKSELKAKIKEMVLAEMNIDVTDETGAYDFLAELEGMLNEAEGLTPLQDYVYQYEIEISGEDRAQEFLDDIKKLNTPGDVYDYYAYERDWQGSMDDDLENIFRQVKRKFKNLSEADETEKDTAEVDTTDVAVDDTETVTTSTEVEVNPDVKAVQDALTQAQVAAQKLGDKKLTDQIGNTITFFTREHVVEKPKAAVAEELTEEYDGYDLDIEFKNSPNQASYENVLDIIGSYEDEGILNNFKNKFPEGKPVSKKDYIKFVMNFIDDMSEVGYIKANWISMFDEDVFEKAGLTENKKPINESMFPMLKKILK